MSVRPLGTIEEELAGCLAANEAHPNAAAYWCHWHNRLLTPATPTETWRQRIDVILTQKPAHERACRLRNFRPVMGRMPEALNQALVDFYQARTALDQACTALDQARTALDQARTAYHQAWLAFDQARTALDQAWRDCDQALVDYYQARVALNQAWTAFDQAQADCKSKLTVQHNAEWPDNTWNGKDIFKAGDR